MKKVIITLAATLAAVLGFAPLAGCNRDAKSSTNEAGSNSKLVHIGVRLKWVFDPGFAGEMVAAKAGFFTKQGLDVELRPGGFEADPIRTVAAGADEIGVAGADSFLLARAKGIPLVAIAGGYLQTPVVFYVNENSPIHTPSDFRGAHVGYQAGQDTATVYEALLSFASLKRSDVKEIPVKYDFSPFLNGDIDVWPGYAASQSFILEREKRPYRTIEPANFGISYIGTVYFTTEKFASEHADAIRGFVAAVVEGWKLSYAEEDKALALIATFDVKTLTPEMVRFTLDKQKATILPKGSRFCEYTHEQWEKTKEILTKQGLLTGPVDISAAVRFDFLKDYYK